MRRPNRFRLPVALAAAVVVIGGTGATYAVAAQDGTPRYRTVAAITADVEQTLSSSGVVDAVQRADLGFGTDGTISRLKVALGDTVKAGQVLARLDATDLQAAVTEANASLAKAVAQLAADKTAQSAEVVEAITPTATQAAQSNSAGNQTGDQGSGQPQVSGAPDTSAVLKKLSALQDEVIASQSAASQALAAATSALATQIEVCAAANTTAVEGAEGAEDPEVSADSGESTPPAVAEDACAVALAEVADRQQQVSEAQDTLAAALDGLAGILTEALDSLGSSGSATSGSASPDSSSAGSSGSSLASSDASDGTRSATQSSSSGGITITAARLASDQAAIEQAEADLIQVQQARAQATLRATRSGKVAAVGASVGDSVSTGSTVITIIGGKAVTVIGSASETQRSQLSVGQAVRVTVPGSSTAAVGHITAIGLAADSSSGASSYPFTVTVDDPEIALPTGSTALLQVVLSTAEGVVTVPTSAVTRNGAQGIVQVRDGDTVTRTTVSLGAVGTRTVEISDGLEAGQQVVLASMDDPITGAGTELAGVGQGGQGGQGRGGGIPPGAGRR